MKIALPQDIAKRITELAITLPCSWEFVRNLVMMGLSDEEITRIGVEIARVGLSEDEFNEIDRADGRTQPCWSRDEPEDGRNYGEIQ